jgi:hypothetical protein
VTLSTAASPFPANPAGEMQQRLRQPAANADVAGRVPGALTSHEPNDYTQLGYINTLAKRYVTR